MPLSGPESAHSLPQRGAALLASVTLFGSFADRAAFHQRSSSRSERPAVDLIALHDALNGLARLDRQQSQIVELFFSGLSIEETASLLVL